MKYVYLLVVLFTLSSCVKDMTSIHTEVSGDNPTESDTNTEIMHSMERNVLQNPPKYVSKNKDERSVIDFDTAYEMCMRALTDYYKAIWNGSEIELDTFIDNINLKKYTQKKIQSQYEVHLKNNLTNNLVKDIDIGAWEMEYTDDLDGGFLYIKLPVQINKTVGSYGEVTEFLVRNVNGKLVIVDWYTGTKDSYDFMERGINLTIDNPDIWNDREWVRGLNSTAD
ncbi:hypothetical protein [Cytobacillus sp.]|uniref:hypothetical protein n=1 Tax=Cytobacillus sp. TaxID=2675269 RepID=UPI0028BE38A6|nr:hypothetical protein [Cytobacillus sp.]